MSSQARAADQLPARKKRSASTLVLQLTLIGVFLLAVVFVFTQTVLAPPSESAKLPPQLGSMKLVSSVSGDEALAEVDQLHGIGIDLVSARVADYAGGNEQMTVWMGRAESSDAAATLLDRMINGITRGGSGFSNVRTIKVGTHTVFQVDGPGGNHYFYQSMDPGSNVYGRPGSGTGVVWLIIQSSEDMPLMEQAMKWF